MSRWLRLGGRSRPRFGSDIRLGRGMIGYPAAWRTAIEKISRGRNEDPHAYPSHVGMIDVEKSPEE